MDDGITCGICHASDELAPMIICDSCDKWFHCPCVSLNAEEADRIATYNCSTCVGMEWVGVGAGRGGDGTSDLGQGGDGLWDVGRGWGWGWELRRQWGWGWGWS